MPPAKFKAKQTRDKGAEALARLKQRWRADNEDEEWEPEKEPVITPMLKTVGIAVVLDALRMHDHDDARGFIEVYEQCSAADLKLIPLEFIAFAAGIGSLRLAEVAQTALYLFASMKTKMLISGAMHKVTKSIIKAATDEVPIVADTLAGRVVVGKTNGDVKAMELFGKMSGIVPVPKGATIAIQNNFAEKDDAPTSPNASWKTPEERLREIQDMTDPKRLPASPAAPITIGGHIDRLQEQTIELMRD